MDALCILLALLAVFVALIAGLRFGFSAGWRNAIDWLSTLDAEDTATILVTRAPASAYITPQAMRERSEAISREILRALRDGKGPDE